MDYFGIECALVSHWEAKENHPLIGNRKLIEEIKGYNRLYPCWIIIPHYTNEMPEPEKLIRELHSYNVKAVRLFPQKHNFSLEDWSIGSLFTELEKNNILTIIDGCEASQLHSLCSKYSRLKFVTTNINLRELYPLIKKFDNLYVSLEKNPVFNIVEDLCKCFGAERIIFGTVHGSFNPYESAGEIPYGLSGSSITMVTYADISEKEKKLIAGDNLKRLLNIDCKPFVKYENSSKILCLARQGQKIETPIIDTHFHLGPFANVYTPTTDVENIIKMMDIIGISKLCINSSGAVFFGENHYKANEYIASVCQKYPERFFGFAVINPNFDNVRGEIKRYLKLGFKGIKIHPRIHQCDLSDERYKPVWEISEKYALPILSHTGEGQPYSSPRAFEKISKDYPKGIFILGHSGDNLKGLKICINIVKRKDNVYLDISDIVFAYPNMLEYTVSQIGAEKILFASDCSFLDFKYALGIVLYARISDEDKSKILGLNMAKILKIPFS